jgi:hypothetical protein
MELLILSERSLGELLGEERLSALRGFIHLRLDPEQLSKKYLTQSRLFLPMLPTSPITTTTANPLPSSAVPAAPRKFHLSSSDVPSFSVFVYTQLNFVL